MSEFPPNWPEIAWQKLPVEIRRRAVLRLQAVYSPSLFEDVHHLVGEHGLNDWPPLGWHFSQGMGVRNALRSDHGIDPPPVIAPIEDRELPRLPEFYGEGVEEGNWDDFYVQCLEAAAGCRPIEEVDRTGVWAHVGVFPADPLKREPGEPHKLRQTIFSGPDFRTPHINRGGLHSSRSAAIAAARELTAALDRLGVPVVASGFIYQPDEALLPACE